MKKGRILKGKGIYLKPIEEKEIEFIRKLRNKPENRRNFFSQNYITKEKQKNWYKDYLKAKDNLMFIIYSLKQEQIGCLSLYDIDSKKKKAQLGRLIIQENYRRKGHAEKAISLVKKYAFEELNLEQLFLSVFEKNNPAFTLYKKLGFQIVKTRQRGKILMIFDKN